MPSHFSSAQALVADIRPGPHFFEGPPPPPPETSPAGGSACPEKSFPPSPKFDSHNPRTPAVHLAPAKTDCPHSADSENHLAIATAPSTLGRPPVCRSSLRIPSSFEDILPPPRILHIGATGGKRIPTSCKTSI